MPLDSLCCENFWVPVEEVPTSTCGFLKSGSIFSFFFFYIKKEYLSRNNWIDAIIYTVSGRCVTVRIEQCFQYKFQG
jgi:hypothetical protein